MKTIILYAGVILSLVLTGCGSDTKHDSDISSSVKAPTSISGKAIKGTITSGAGVLASSGRSTFVASDTDTTYKVLGDGRNTVNSSGTFLYSAKDDKATITFEDSVAGKGTYYFTFTSKNSGSYTAEIEQSPVAMQTGTFELQ